MSVEKQQAQVFLDAAARLEAAKENNFCPRCGKRLRKEFIEISIHTCTPPEARK
jgi:NADH pyrophosphatase NudC (nudix superfamily)